MNEDEKTTDMPPVTKEQFSVLVEDLRRVSNYLFNVRSELNRVDHIVRIAIDQCDSWKRRFPIEISLSQQTINLGNEKDQSK